MKIMNLPRLTSPRWKWGVFVAAVCLGLVTSTETAQGKWMEHQGKMLDIAEPGEILSGEVIMEMRSGISLQQAATAASVLGGRITGVIEEYGLYRIKLAPVKGVEVDLDATSRAVAAAQRLPDVKAAFPNYKFSVPKPVEFPDATKLGPLDSSPLTALESDASEADATAPLGQQWHLNVINLSRAGTPQSGPVVAVLDTGVQYNHPDLEGRVIPGKDYVDDDMDPMDENGHGTHCAGLVAARGLYMVKGVSPLATRVLAVRVLNASASGSFFDIMDGIVYARNYTGVKIISMSFGGYMRQGSAEFKTFKKVLDDTLAKGVIPVAAAGNENNYWLYYYESTDKYRPVPAWYRSTFTVGATIENNMRAYFSNYDIGTRSGLTFNYRFVDIVAPGWNILSTYLNNQVARSNGTSMACPIVAGAAAFYWGSNPSKTAAQVISALASTGMPVGVYYGFPSPERRLDLMKAVGRKATGFVGVVYNGQTGMPLKGTTLSVKQGSTPIKTVKTDYEGFFTVSGLTGGTTYHLTFSRAGFASHSVKTAAAADTMKNLAKPVFLHQRRPAGQWSVLIDWRSWQPGYDEAKVVYSSGGRPSWYPYDWDTLAGTFMSPYVHSSAYGGTVDLSNQGSLTQSPYMALTTDPYHSGTRPASNFVIKPQSGTTYKIYTLLDNVNSMYFEWGRYKTEADISQPAVQARLYLGGGLKATVNAGSATGKGAYWYVGDISGTTFTVKNTLRATAP